MTAIRVLRKSETFVYHKRKSPLPGSLATGFSKPFVFSVCQVRSFRMPVLRHVQQQKQHWRQLWREAFIGSVYRRDSLIYVSTLLMTNLHAKFQSCVSKFQCLSMGHRRAFAALGLLHQEQ